MRIKISFFAFLLIFFVGLVDVSFTADQSMDIKQIIEIANQFKKEKNLKFNFQNIDIKLLTYFMSSVTNKNIVIDPTISGNVSFVSSTKIGINEAWDIYSSILKSMGFIIIDRNTHLEILREGNRKTIPPLKDITGKSDKIVTFTYQLNSEPNNALNILNSIKSPAAVINLHRPTNMLIITDYENNISTMQNILKIIDDDNQNLEVKSYKLNFIDENIAVNVISKMFGDLAQKNIPFIISEIKGYGFIVKTQKNIFVELESMLKQIDVDSATKDNRKFYTYRLVHSKAEEIADIINKSLDNINLLNILDNVSKQSTQMQQTSQNKPKIIADKSSNALIILANSYEYSLIKSLIESVDVRKKQVLISALITEVSESAIKELGVRWQFFGSQGGAAFKGGLSDTGLFSLMGSSGFATGFLSRSGQNLKIGDTSMFFPDLLFLFSLLNQGTGFNIISSPKILTLDNAPAQITVSQVVPFASSVKYDINGNPLIGYDYKEVGIKLKLTPRISENNVILDLHQEANDVLGYQNPKVGTIEYMVPITSKREIETQVNVDNGKTVILGGIVSKKTIKTMEGIPFLSDIPLIGRLFRYDKDDFSRTYLFVFITPHIINSPEDLAKITEEHQKLADELNKKINEQKEKKKKQNEESKELKWYE
ncbi:MAG: type II secretion system secretin GspD [Calditerrivibrio sp.]|nr:type II secretion system secretin GspD [Calditerrivibrio sp.]